VPASLIAVTFRRLEALESPGIRRWTPADVACVTLTPTAAHGRSRTGCNRRTPRAGMNSPVR